MTIKTQVVLIVFILLFQTSCGNEKTSSHGSNSQANYSLIVTADSNLAGVQWEMSTTSLITKQSLMQFSSQTIDPSVHVLMRPKLQNEKMNEWIVVTKNERKNQWLLFQLSNIDKEQLPIISNSKCVDKYGSSIHNCKIYWMKQ